MSHRFGALEVVSHALRALYLLVAPSDFVDHASPIVENVQQHHTERHPRQQAKTDALWCVEWRLEKGEQAGDQSQRGQAKRFSVVVKSVNIWSVPTNYEQNKATAE